MLFKQLAIIYSFSLLFFSAHWKSHESLNVMTKTMYHNFTSTERNLTTILLFLTAVTTISGFV